MSDTLPEAFTCIVCGEAGGTMTSAECNWCGARYHLNQRNDVEAKDCGQVWVDEQFLALQFACANCLSGESPPEPAFRVTAGKARAPRRRYRRRA